MQKEIYRSEFDLLLAIERSVSLLILEIYNEIVSLK